MVVHLVSYFRLAMLAVVEFLEFVERRVSLLSNLLFLLAPVFVRSWGFIVYGVGRSGNGHWLQTDPVYRFHE